MLAIDHGDRAEEALPADMFLAQIAEADAGLPDMSSAREMDPRPHGFFLPLLAWACRADSLRRFGCRQQRGRPHGGVEGRIHARRAFPGQFRHRDAGMQTTRRNRAKYLTQ
jgi:hypothetical protein